MFHSVGRGCLQLSVLGSSSAGNSTLVWSGHGALLVDCGFASGYMLKTATGDALNDAIVSVAKGGSLLDPIVTSHVLDRLRADGGRREEQVDPLSGQERRVLALVALGKTNREIAAEIQLSEKTVKNYVSSILNKLRMHRRSEAAAFVARQEAHDQ